MPSKKSTGVTAIAYPSGQSDYQCEEDVRTLTRAAEVLANRGRSSMALKKFKKQQVGGDKLINLLVASRLRRNTRG